MPISIYLSVIIDKLFMLVDIQSQHGWDVNPLQDIMHTHIDMLTNSVMSLLELGSNLEL